MNVYVTRGIFKIGQKYVSLAGHLSTKYGEKVWKLSRSLLPIVEVTKLSRSKAWPKRWNVSKPNDDNIGLYFLPHEMRSLTKTFALAFHMFVPPFPYTKSPFYFEISRENEEMDQLLKEVIENDLALRAIIGEAEMLIFHSILLPKQYQSMLRVFLKCKIYGYIDHLLFCHSPFYHIFMQHLKENTIYGEYSNEENMKVSW